MTRSAERARTLYRRSRWLLAVVFALLAVLTVLCIYGRGESVAVRVLTVCMLLLWLGFLVVRLRAERVDPKLAHEARGPVSFARSRLIWPYVEVVRRIEKQSAEAVERMAARDGCHEITGKEERAPDENLRGRP